MLGRKLVDMFLAIFDNGQFQRHADLRRRQTDAWRRAHGVEHGTDQFLNRRGKDFIGSQLP